jgi:hypothetical protein
MDQSYMTMGNPTLKGGQVSPAASCQGGIFVPVQDSSEMWPPDQALAMGTVFPCLYSPWEKGENTYG